jgi:hypothetical protein
VSNGTLTVAQSTFSNNAGGGLSVSNGTLTVAQSTFSNNTSGGMDVNNSAFTIVGNVFFANGTQSTTNGGIKISTTDNAANRLEFNTFAKNATQDSLGSAVQCVAGNFTARNNIMSGNGTISQLDQTSGSCKHIYSIVRPGNPPAGPGTGNLTTDPMFANLAMGNLHIPATSPAHHAADPAADLTGIAAKDLDGVARTNPADIGAFQVP